MNTEPSPLADVPVNHEADAKDALREQGIVTGPDRFGNWCVPCGTQGITDWRPGDPTDERVLVRNNGALAGTPANSMRWGWQEGQWVENVTGISEDDLAPVGEALPFIY